MTISPVKLDTLILDSAAQPRIDIDWVLASEYAEAMRDGAKFPPIIVYANGKNWLADGFHRVAAAKQAGLSELAADIRQGTRRDAILYSVGANSENGKRRTNEDKRRAVLTLLQDEEWGKWSDNEIAKRCAVSHTFVDNVRSSLATVASDTQERTYTTKHGTIATMHTANIGGRIDMSALWNAEQERKRSINYHVSDDSYEWYTPQEYIDAARLVMGAIDLDPASSQEAQKVVGAKRFYTKEDDGLAHKWHGCVYLNPPYCMPDVENFVEKTVWSFDSGEIEQAIILTNNSTDAGWFHKILNRAGIACFTRGRVKYWGPNSAQARQGQVFFYLGKNVKGFIKHFGQFGIIVKVA